MTSKFISLPICRTQIHTFYEVFNIFLQTFKGYYNFIMFKNKPSHIVPSFSLPRLSCLSWWHFHPSTLCQKLWTRPPFLRSVCQQKWSALSSKNIQNLTTSHPHMPRPQFKCLISELVYGNRLLSGHLASSSPTLCYLRVFPVCKSEWFFLIACQIMSLLCLKFFSGFLYCGVKVQAFVI